MMWEQKHYYRLETRSIKMSVGWTIYWFIIAIVNLYTFNQVFWFLLRILQKKVYKHKNSLILISIDGS